MCLHVVCGMPVEAERAVERDSAVDVAREQNDLRSPEELHTPSLTSHASCHKTTVFGRVVTWR